MLPTAIVIRVALLASDKVLGEKEFQPTARGTITTLIDDVDSTEAERTVAFSLDGTSYEIDLSRGNISFTSGLEPFITAGRQIGRRASATGTSSGVDLGEVRQWARDQGIAISDRGRVSKQVMKAYQER